MGYSVRVGLGREVGVRVGAGVGIRVGVGVGVGHSIRARDRFRGWARAFAHSSAPLRGVTSPSLMVTALF